MTTSTTSVRVEHDDTPLGRALVAAIDAQEGLERARGEACDAVVDAGVEPAGLERVRAALDAGSHWVDLCWERGWSEEVATLDEHAKSVERAAVCSAGAFCGLTDPFVRASADEMVRVNEVQLGLTVGSGAEIDPSSMGRFLAARDASIEMLIGGEWSKREFYGDRRAYGFPPPIGERFGGNADCTDLAVFTQRPVRSASVRLTVAPPSPRAERASRRFLDWVGKGRIKEDGMVARALGALDRYGKNGPSALAISVRGIGPTRLPLELRTGFVAAPGSARAFSVAPAIEALLAIAKEPNPGAGPCVGRLDRAALEARLTAAGVTVTTGDMGGWKGA